MFNISPWPFGIVRNNYLRKYIISLLIERFTFHVLREFCLLGTFKHKDDNVCWGAEAKS